MSTYAVVRSHFMKEHTPFSRYNSDNMSTYAVVRSNFMQEHTSFSRYNSDNFFFARKL